MRDNMMSSKDFSNLSFSNTTQMQGFSFVEFACNDIQKKDMLQTFQNFGFSAPLKHKNFNIYLLTHGNIVFFVNAEKKSFAATYERKHGVSACGVAFNVEDPECAYQEAIARGAEPCENAKNTKDKSLGFPAIIGIGGSLIYFVNTQSLQKFLGENFPGYTVNESQQKPGGLLAIDHIANNAYQGNTEKWCNFYKKIFAFSEQKVFNVRGEKTGLISVAMISPCGNIRIPINEATEETSQIAEFLKQHNGEGIQHIALSTENILHTVEDLKANGIEFLDTTSAYYAVVKQKFHEISLPWDKIEKLQILVDGQKSNLKYNLLFQIFTKTIVGPLFFEVIQRNGHSGFGEGNFAALFRSMEIDQEKRGLFE